MKLIEEVIHEGDRASVRLSYECQRFLAAFFATRPTRQEKLVVAHLQTVGLWQPWHPPTLSKETGVSVKDIEDALGVLVKKGVVRIKLQCGMPGLPAGVEPEINERFGQ